MMFRGVQKEINGTKLFKLDLLLKLSDGEDAMDQDNTEVCSKTDQTNKEFTSQRLCNFFYII